MNILKKVFNRLMELCRPSKEVSEDVVQDEKKTIHEGAFDLEADKYYKVKGDYLLYVGKDMMFLTNSRIGGMMIVPFYNEDDADMQGQYNGDGTIDDAEVDMDLFFEDFQHEEGEERGMSSRPSSIFTVTLEDFEGKVQYYSLDTLKEVLLAAEEEEKYSYAAILRDEINHRKENG